MSDTNKKIVAYSDSPSRIIVKTQGFQGIDLPDIIIEQPPSLTRKDRGAGPIDHMLAGLVGSINWIGHLVAEEMGFEIHKLEIEVEGKFNVEYAFGQTQESFEDARAGLKQIKVAIHIEADVDEERLELWRKAIRFRCPIIDNLTNPTRVKVRIE